MSNSPKKQNSKLRNPLQPASLDAFDKNLLQILQDDFPIVAQPWLEISRRLDISESEVIFRLRRFNGNRRGFKGWSDF